MQDIDLDLLRSEPTTTIGVVFPKSMAEAVEQCAKSELISRSSWLRRAVLTALQERAA